ncbi:MAG: hypothetical protein AMXMBFR83_00970 [Phycisphaerae bacterium]
MARCGRGRRFLLLGTGFAAAWVLLWAGCGWPDDPAASPDANGSLTSTQQPEVVLAGTSERPPAADQFAEVEPNDGFETAQPISFLETVRLNGAIAGQKIPLDVDIYDLGAVGPGDRVLADLTIEPGGDVILGLLDDRLRLIGHIDPSSATSGPRQADVVIREASSRLYVAVGTRSSLSIDRPYQAGVSVQRDAVRPSSRPQIVVLDFSGAAGVRIGSRPPVDVPPFDAAVINPAYQGRTQEMIAAILLAVREDFAGLEVAVYRDGDPDLPAGPRSTVYYGTFDSRLLGLADNVDPYNADAEQSAILFTDTFALFNPLAPSLAQMTQVLANTTSHEAGHLLGLRHTSDPADLMDTTATARQMMADQDFGFAGLNASVMPVGFQDAPALLSWTVGGGLLTPSAGKTAERLKAVESAGGPDDFYIPRSWLMTCSCHPCGG